MKHLILLFSSMVFVTLSSQAQDINDKTKVDTASLIGNWQIDLGPTPDAEAYYQSFIVNKINGNTFTGTFYGSPVNDGLINPNWDKVYFAFSTSDQTNTYYHSGYIQNGMLHGITYCPDRSFTAPWTGTQTE